MYMLKKYVIPVFPNVSKKRSYIYVSEIIPHDTVVYIINVRVYYKKGS